MKRNGEGQPASPVPGGIREVAEGEALAPVRLLGRDFLAEVVALVGVRPASLRFFIDGIKRPIRGRTTVQAVGLLAVVLLVGCGSGSNPNEAVANDLIQRGILDDLCYHVHVHGRQDAAHWLVYDLSLGKPAWADRHIFLNGSTPEGVTAELLPHCLPDGTWTLDEH